MPSEMKNPWGLSPSFLREEAQFSDERQVNSVWSMDRIPDYSGLKLDGTLRPTGVVPSSIENRTQLVPQIANAFDLPEYYLNHSQNTNLSLGKNIVETERAASRSLPSFVDHNQSARTNLNTESASYLFGINKMNLMGAQYENGLFSSSMSDLFSRKLMLPSNNASYVHSIGAGDSHHEEDETFESLQELEALTIGNLLPDDEDLLSGVTDGFDSIIKSNDRDGLEDLDLFSNVGGLELGDDGFLLRKSELSDVNSEHELRVLGVPDCRERPCRTLFVRNINRDVEEPELRAMFEQYGDIHSLYTACKDRGFIMVSYYDIRAALNALKDLNNKQLQHRKLDIHFSIPKENLLEKDINQAAFVVSNIDSTVSNDELLEIFGIYGEVKEIHETSHRSRHRFVEYYDVRAAESARRALKKRLTQPFSPELKSEESNFHLQRHGSSILATGFSGSLPLGGSTASVDNDAILGPHTMTGGSLSLHLDSMDHIMVSSCVANSLPSLGIPVLHPHSLPEYRDGLLNWPPFNSPTNMGMTISSRPPEMLENLQFHKVSSNGQQSELNKGSGGLSGNGSHYMWTNSSHTQSQSFVWPNSPSFVNGIGAALPQHLNAVSRAPSHMLNGLLPLNNHHVGSAPSVNIWDRRHAYTGESPDTAVFHPGSLGTMRISGNSPHPLEFVPHNMFPRTGGNGMDMSVLSKSNGLHPHQRCMIFPTRGQMIPMMNSFDSPNERTRNRRNEGNSSQADNKKQFELDVDRIVRGEDKRTTLMIKNIPNKYTSKMLLAAIDECHRGTYDFIYLPIDFKNKCNVGYAFINMTDPALIVPFYKTFDGKKWEKFNSEKVASLAYARIQGKAALIAHFQNSSLMNEDKRCRPILFHTEGPNAGDQVPFPMGTSIRPRPGKVRASSSEEQNQEMPSSSLNEDYANGDSSSGSGKESD